MIPLFSTPWWDIYFKTGVSIQVSNKHWLRKSQGFYPCKSARFFISVYWITLTAYLFSQDYSWLLNISIVVAHTPVIIDSHIFFNRRLYYSSSYALFRPDVEPALTWTHHTSMITPKRSRQAQLFPTCRVPDTGMLPRKRAYVRYYSLPYPFNCYGYLDWWCRHSTGAPDIVSSEQYRASRVAYKCLARLSGFDFTAEPLRNSTSSVTQDERSALMITRPIIIYHLRHFKLPSKTTGRQHTR